jgi:hypothetical protein
VSLNLHALYADSWLVAAPLAWLAGRALAFNVAHKFGWPTTYGAYPGPNRSFFTRRGKHA